MVYIAIFEMVVVRVSEQRTGVAVSNLDFSLCVSIALVLTTFLISLILYTLISCFGHLLIEMKVLNDQSKVSSDSLRIFSFLLAFVNIYLISRGSSHIIGVSLSSSCSITSLR